MPSERDLNSKEISSFSSGLQRECPALCGVEKKANASCHKTMPKTSVLNLCICVCLCLYEYQLMEGEGGKNVQFYTLKYTVSLNIPTST
jgi:hypothetical protein